MENDTISIADSIITIIISSRSYDQEIKKK